MVERYRKLWERPWQAGMAKFIYSPRFPLLCEQVMRNVTRGNTTFMRHREGLTSGVACHLTYDELCAAPESTIKWLAASPARGIGRGMATSRI